MTHRIRQSHRAVGAAFAAAAFAFVPLTAAMAQQATPVVPAAPPAAVSGPVTAQAPATLPLPAGTAQPAAAGTVPAAPGQATTAAAGASPAPGVSPASAIVKSAAPEEANPFSNVKTTDDNAVKQELPVLEQRLKLMEDKMTQIQQVQAVLPADALSSPGAAHAHGPGGSAGAGADQASMELETATFVACVNGKALFRDTDQKPFFVDAKEANQNEAVRRIGGCKH